uniref:Protein S100 n=1 Tax=Equus asinus TaxID=9793 RepID=A0A8C4KYU1_EQUAS
MADSYTELEKAVVVLVENFYKYVSKHSLVKNKISKSSFRKMLQKELNHMLTDTGNRKAADKLIQNLDANHDGRISFDEYWTLIDPQPSKTGLPQNSLQSRQHAGLPSHLSFTATLPQLKIEGLPFICPGGCS